MKRKLFICLMMLCSLVAMSKKGVVLESNGKATMYSDLTTAVNAAVDGDVIYLVRNTSYDCPKGLLIQRLIQLRGDGTPTINGDVTISIDGMPDMKEPVIEGIIVNGKVTVTQSINNFKLRHCQFSTIQFAAPMPNGLIDRCYARDDFMIPPVSENFTVRNSRIYNLTSTSLDNNTTLFVNCNIYYIHCEFAAGKFVNCLINRGYDYEKFALKNSVLASCGYCYDVFRRDYYTTIEFNCSNPSYKDMDLESKIISRELLQALYDDGKTLGTAESCTGGRIAQTIIAAPGSSNYFKGGIVSYTNEVKENLLHVDHATLEEFTAVSEPVAKQMVIGACNALNVDYAIACTGVAGPGGGTPQNPVGTIWIAYGSKDDIRTIKLTEDEGRDMNISTATCTALRAFLEYHGHSRAR